MREPRPGPATAYTAIDVYQQCGACTLRPPILPRTEAGGGVRLRLRYRCAVAPAAGVQRVVTHTLWVAD